MKFVLFARIITACRKGAQWRFTFVSSPEIVHIYISRILLSDRSTSRKRRPARPHIVITTLFSKQTYKENYWDGRLGHCAWYISAWGR
jgi:hypothetical protein